MPQSAGISRRCLVAALLLCLWLVATHGRTQSLWQEEEQRFRVGLKLFPAVLGAVEDLEDKRASDGQREIRVVYEGSDTIARDAASALRGIGRIREIPLNVQTLSAEALDADNAQLGGIFVASIDVGASGFAAGRSVIAPWSSRPSRVMWRPAPRRESMSRTASSPS